MIGQRGNLRVELAEHSLQQRSEIYFKFGWGVIWGWGYFRFVLTVFSFALSSFLREFPKQCRVTKNGFSVSSIFITNFAGKKPVCFFGPSFWPWKYIFNLILEESENIMNLQTTNCHPWRRKHIIFRLGWRHFWVLWERPDNAHRKEISCLSRGLNS